MTPEKIKADEIFNEYYQALPARMGRYEMAKQCSLILVDQMASIGFLVGSDLSDTFYIYWQEVKKEIENL